MNRREFLTGVVAAAARTGLGEAAQPAASGARVVVVSATDRRDGVRRALALWGDAALARKHVVLKPNFNSADAFPGSTHLETLAGLVEWLGTAGVSRVTVADRSGMGVTREVMSAKGVFDQGRRLGYGTEVLDELPTRDWIARGLPGSHWSRGVLFPRLLEEAEAIVSTCCLKTHRFGGHFTLSLKNSVGAVAKSGADGYDYMRELHGSRPQRAMIAELNQLYQPSLVLLDGMEAFVGGGPEAGKRAAPGLIVVGRDRVAVDAVGVAALRLFGAGGAVATGPIFAQEQIARAAELGLGVARPEGIELVSDDRAGLDLAARLRGALLRS